VKEKGIEVCVFVAVIQLDSDVHCTVTHCRTFYEKQFHILKLSIKWLRKDACKMCSKHVFIKFSKDKTHLIKKTIQTSHRSRLGLPQKGCT
jgi:hypothetical protein